jgi:hypothetical protein
LDDLPPLLPEISRALAILACALWPFSALWALVGWRGPVIGAEKRALLEEREKRVRNLESELGVESPDFVPSAWKRTP